MWMGVSTGLRTTWPGRLQGRLVLDTSQAGFFSLATLGVVNAACLPSCPGGQQER